MAINMDTPSNPFKTQLMNRKNKTQRSQADEILLTISILKTKRKRFSAINYITLTFILGIL